MKYNAEDAVLHTVTVETSKEHAFSVFTDGLTGWWPSEYTWAQDTLEARSSSPGRTEDVPSRVPKVSSATGDGY